MMFDEYPLYRNIIREEKKRVELLIFIGSLFIFFNSYNFESDLFNYNLYFKFFLILIV